MFNLSKKSGRRQPHVERTTHGWPGNSFICTSAVGQNMTGQTSVIHTTSNSIPPTKTANNCSFVNQRSLTYKECSKDAYRLKCRNDTWEGLTARRPTLTT